ncbi:hypothetical protein [Bythopirellula polymerisocia]|uniref:Uncharacterized protein n=1 Tax=Bythopirellula polymerisocia TaxID=2528003 RepID=A0A5C6CW03_9BACT|nr:hypothetical protein [Bythopirellula polymerisocia]TWU27874.1 hypothetical protein Pla144_26510 [Bythopirellula polymerisocia]
MALHVFYIWFCFQLAAFIYLGIVVFFYHVFGMEPAHGLASMGIFCLWGLLYALSFLLPGWLRGHAGGIDSRSSKSNVLRLVIVFGVFASLLSMLWLLGGAGIYGSPVGTAFKYGSTNSLSSETWLFLYVTSGPMAILPLSCLELHKPGWGARAMIAVSIVGPLVAVIVTSPNPFQNPILLPAFWFVLACLFGPLAGVGLFLLLRRHLIA